MFESSRSRFENVDVRTFSIIRNAEDVMTSKEFRRAAAIWSGSRKGEGTKMGP
jgi:hypothetical protein